MQNQVRALIIRYTTVRIVRVLAFLKIDDEPLVARCVLIQLQRVGEAFCTDKEREATLGGTMQLFKEETLHVGRPAFVEPEMGCVGVTGTNGQFWR